MASMQAVTRVNAEQASKKVMREPTHLNYGEGRCRWGRRATQAPSGPAGVVATACKQRRSSATRETPAVASERQPGAREGQAGPHGVAERLVVPGKPGNSGGGKGPQFKADVKGARAGRLV